MHLTQINSDIVSPLFEIRCDRLCQKFAPMPVVPQGQPTYEERQMLQVLPSIDEGIECPFNRNGKAEISIFNPNQFKVAFKLRRTLPDFITVRPGYGYVRPQEFKLIKARVYIRFETVTELTNFFAAFQVEVGKVKEENTVSHSEHRISVLACQAPAAAPKCAKDVWRLGKPEYTSKMSVPVKFKKYESSSSSSSSDADTDESSSTTTTNESDSSDVSSATSTNDVSSNEETSKNSSDTSTNDSGVSTTTTESTTIEDDSD